MVYTEFYSSLYKSSGGPWTKRRFKAPYQNPVANFLKGASTLNLAPALHEITPETHFLTLN